MLHAVRSARHAVDHDHRVFRIDEQLGRFAQRGHLGLRRRRRRIARDVERRAVVVHELFLQAAVERDHDRLMRRRHHVLVGAHHGLREVLQRDWLVVPFGKIAHQRIDVLGGVRGRHARRTLGGVEIGAAHQQNGCAIAPGVVDRHGGVLEADGAVAEHHLRLASDLEIAVRHRDRGFLVHAGDELRLGIPAVVDQRLMQAAEARSGVGIDIVDIERLDHVHHEVGAGAARNRLHLGDDVGFERDLMGSWPHCGGDSRGTGRRRGFRDARGCCSTSDGGTGQEFATANLGARIFACHSCSSLCARDRGDPTRIAPNHHGCQSTPDHCRRQKHRPGTRPGRRYFIAIWQWSARLHPHVHQRRLARLHGRDRALERGTELVRILDRSDPRPAHRGGELGIIDVRILDAGAHRS